MTIPTDRRYAETHEWARLDGDVVTVGITQHAVEHLTDLTHLDLPDVGTELEKDQNFGTIESVKAVSDMFSPVAGEVIEVNEELADEVERLSPESAWNEWLMKLKVSSADALEGLMDAEGYEKQMDEEA